MGRTSEDVFSTWREAFASAAEAAHRSSTTHLVAGLPVEIQIAGIRLANTIARPLSHLPVAEGTTVASGLRVELWSEEETGVSRPPLELNDAVASHGDPADALRVESGGGRFLRYESDRTVLWLDRELDRVVGWVGAAERLNQYERGRPLHALLGPWLAQRGLRILHAGLVAVGTRGVLLPGPPRSGKTTTALACTRAGMSCVGEDVTILAREADRNWSGHGVYSTAKLNAQQLAWFPELSSLGEPGLSPDEPKSLVFAGEAYPDAFVASAEVAALAFPRISADGQTRCEPLRGGEGLRDLIASTIATSGDPRTLEFFSLLGDLCASVPTYRLELGRRLGEVAEAITELARATSEAVDSG
jgi:hypothetical protein